MSKRFKPYRVAWIIEKIKEDVHPKEIFKQVKLLGWTDAKKTKAFWDQTKHWIYRLTGKSFIEFVKKDTVSYNRYIEYFYKYENIMANKKKQNTNNNLNDYGLDNEELLIVIDSLKETISELEEELKKKKQEKNKIKAQIVWRIKEKIQKLNRKFQTQKICNIIGIAKRTFNDQSKKDAIFLKRKVNLNAKCNSIDVISDVIAEYMENEGVYGFKRVKISLENKGRHYSFSLVRTILKRSNLKANEVRIRRKKYEDKNTNFIGRYLLSVESLKKYKPGEVFSIDFTQIEIAGLRAWLHGAVDVISRKILFIEICFDQKKETVLEHYKKHLPKTTKIINTDYGASYLSYDVQKYLKSRNIKQSLGRVGISYDNRWIENIWKRIKYEWFTIYPTNNCNSDKVSHIIKEYTNYYNNIRLTKIDGSWTTPSMYASNFI